MWSDFVKECSELELWQIEQTKQAIAEADAGDFVTRAELQAVLQKYDAQIIVSKAPQ